ncbi:MAG: hypothetical protein E5Y34_06555 [Mesorhizobium sp.]|uniref:hypothetical protein n=1 Tax=Mesorhizobium sp. TaxID=1871066 RepID=UPI0012149DD8|nr:hypothetical protein [Mesorhizobium sp.]TIN02685.1 MAG: hypothetical protein E5Y34_06555 [Mesorhizobium sp.]
MGQQLIDIGATANDGTGTKARAGGDMINDNFTELYAQFGKVPSNAQTGTTYTLSLTDIGKGVTLDNASPIALTIPAHADVALPVGAVISVAGIGAGAVTVNGDTGVSVNGSSGGSVVLDGSWIPATLWQYDTDLWMAFGRFA